MRTFRSKIPLLSYYFLMLASCFQQGCRDISSLHDESSQISSLSSHPIKVEDETESNETATPSESSDILSLSSFAPGINIAWVDFAHDVGTGTPKLDEIEKQLTQLSAAGGKVARLWVHTDGSLTPQFRGNRVVGPGVSTISDLKKILDLAEAQNIKLMLTLWSFDMIRAEMKKTNPERVHRNRLLLTESSYLKDYIKYSLNPMVKALQDHPALHSWDICNEPEGMTTNEAWGNIEPSDRVEITDLQEFINKTAGAIHSIAPQNKVTVGAVSFKYLAAQGPQGNIYKDSALIAQGGDSKGTLDFYQGHHYAKIGAEWSPFQNHVKDFGLDKPTLVGEFDMKEYLDYGTTSPRQLYQKLHQQGYVGALGWKDGAIPALQVMLTAINSLYYTAPRETQANACSKFQGGFGKPFFSGTKLYRNRIDKDSPTAEGWCLVD